MYVDHGSYVELDGARIPRDEGNADYARFLAWVDAGNTPGQPPEPTHAELVERAKVEIRAQRQPIIDVLTGLQSSSLALGNAERAAVIETAKAGLRNLTSTDLSACVTYEDMRLVVKAAYLALAAALPADVRQAFSDALK